jgi:UDP-glucose 4-epimerase
MLIASSSKRAVVLGAGGFLGLNLVSELVNRGFAVLCFDRKPSPNWPAGVRTIVGNLADVQTDLLAQMDGACVFHLASSGKPSNRTDSIGAELASEVLATVRLLELTTRLNTRWVYVSSGGTVYGQIDTTELINETCPTEPISSYGVAKLTVERYFALYRKIHGTNYSIARVANPYGPWQSPFVGQGIIATLIHKALTQQSIEIWGDGENVRDYLHVCDVASGLLQIAENGASGEVYNLGSQAGASVNQLISVVGRVLGVKLTPSYVAARASDVRYSVLDTHKLRSIGPWRPSKALEKGIEETGQWMRDNVVLK